MASFDWGVLERSHPGLTHAAIRAPGMLVTMKVAVGKPVLHPSGRWIPGEDGVVRDYGLIGAAGGTDFNYAGTLEANPKYAQAIQAAALKGTPGWDPSRRDQGAPNIDVNVTADPTLFEVAARAAAAGKTSLGFMKPPEQPSRVDTPVVTNRFGDVLSSGVATPTPLAGLISIPRDFPVPPVRTPSTAVGSGVSAALVPTSGTPLPAPQGTTWDSTQSAPVTTAGSGSRPPLTPPGAPVKDFKKEAADMAAAVIAIANGVDPKAYVTGALEVLRSAAGAA